MFNDGAVALVMVMAFGQPAQEVPDIAGCPHQVFDHHTLIIYAPVIPVTVRADQKGQVDLRLHTNQNRGYA